MVPLKQEISKGRRRSFFAGLLLASTVAVAPIHAQSDDSVQEPASLDGPTDTLREALTEAYLNNPTLASVRAQVRATDETVPIAEADGRPSVAATGSYSEYLIQSGSGNGGLDRSVAGQVDLSVPVYNGGLVRNSVNAAENRVEQARAQLRATESAIFSQTVAAYMNVIRDEAIVDLNRNNVDNLGINLRATRDRFEIGDVTRTDVAQSEARLSLGLADLESARSNLIQSKEQFIQLVGEAPGDLQSPPPLPNLPSSPNQAVDVALENNPDLIAAREAVDAAGFDRLAANASKRPTVSAFVRPTYSNNLGTIGQVPGSVFVTPNSAFDTIVGVSARMPILQGGRATAQIRRAQAFLSQAQEQEIAAEREVIAQVRAAYSSWQASLEVIKAAQRSVSANALALEGTRAENTVGTRTILDILNAEQEYLNAQVRLVTARRNAYVAGFSLLAAMGRAEARDLGLDGGLLYDPMIYYDDIATSGDWLGLSDYRAVPEDPEAQSTRTVDSQPQRADIKPVPDY